ncbi:major facilitator superfamily transporter [Colletotrichum kahawae]|uniref:Major facilitator superfamily transporter n=1 Tax=Colletotrichum kahawae TaxID=34407 RepID=A0AAD9YBZ9_COLKA|nr:major facilitator superfamily transporter [Colletotrichum kahawae]
MKGPSTSARPSLSEGCVEVISPSSSICVSDDTTTRGSRCAGFSRTQRHWVVLLVALAAFVAPLSVFIYVPIIDTLSEELHVSIEFINITIASYLIVQGLVPALLSNIADHVGRRPVYLVSLFTFCASCVGLALQRSYSELLVFRMIQSAGTSNLLSLGAMVVSDIAPAHSRGRYMSAMLTGVNLGPVVGPFIGGIMDDEIGWHQSFWLLLAFGAACWTCLFFFLPETCQDTVNDSIKMERKVSWPVSFTCIQDSLAHLAMEKYKLNGLQAGLCYVLYGLAVFITAYAVGKIIDHDYTTVARSHGISISDFVGHNFASFPIERARLRTVWYLFPLVIASTVFYGWAVEYKINLGLIMITQFICCLASTGISNTCLTLYMDLHPRNPGVASIAMNLVRSIAAAAGVAVVQLLVEEFGTGWTFTAYGATCLASVPMLLAVRAWGPRWREAGS